MNNYKQATKSGSGGKKATAAWAQLEKHKEVDFLLKVFMKDGRNAKSSVPATLSKKLITGDESTPSNSDVESNGASNDLEDPDLESIVGSGRMREQLLNTSTGGHHRDDPLNLVDEDLAVPSTSAQSTAKKRHKAQQVPKSSRKRALTSGDVEIEKAKLLAGRALEKMSPTAPGPAAAQDCEKEHVAEKHSYELIVDSLKKKIMTLPEPERSQVITEKILPLLGELCSTKMVVHVETDDNGTEKYFL